MKRLLPFLFLLQTTCGFSQSLTNGQIYNYSVGDVFYRKLGQGAAYRFDSIISKTFSQNNDTVVYISRQVAYDYNQFLPGWTATQGVISYSYTNLNAAPSLTVYTMTDTLVKDTAYLDNQYCGVKALKRTYKQRMHNLISEHYIRDYDLYLEGLGYSFRTTHVNPNFVYSSELMYYRKGNVECGTLNIPTGIKTQYLNSVFKCSPNPVTDKLKLEFGDQFPAEMHVTIHDLCGRIVLQQKLQQNEIDLETLWPGIYLLSLETDHTVYTKKIIKE